MIFFGPTTYSLQRWSDGEMDSPSSEPAPEALKEGKMRRIKICGGIDADKLVTAWS
jgi:hypothetical protein